MAKNERKSRKVCEEFKEGKIVIDTLRKDLKPGEEFIPLIIMLEGKEFRFYKRKEAEMFCRKLEDVIDKINGDMDEIEWEEP